MECENMSMPELKCLARDHGLRNYSWMRKTELVALLQNNGTPEGPRAAVPLTRPPPSPPLRHTAYLTLKSDYNGCCRIHSLKRGEASVSDGDKEIVTNERYLVMPWKVVNVDSKKVSLKEAVDEIFSNQDELTNPTCMTLKLDNKGNCKIHRTKCGEANVYDRDREIVTTERYVLMPWKVANRHGKMVKMLKR